MSNYIVVLSVIPLKAKRQKGSFDLFDEISKIFSNNKILLKNGDVIVIPSNIPHSGRALTKCILMDVFSPVREEYK